MNSNIQEYSIRPSRDGFQVVDNYWKTVVKNVNTTKEATNLVNALLEAGEPIIRF